MEAETLDTITYEEFEKRLAANNERLQQELIETQERMQQLEMLIARKEAFSQRLTEVLTEIEREEKEIAALEKRLHLPRKVTRHRASATPTPL